MELNVKKLPISFVNKFMKWDYNGHVYWMVTAGGFFNLSAETGIVIY